MKLKLQRAFINLLEELLDCQKLPHGEDATTLEQTVNIPQVGQRTYIIAIYEKPEETNHEDA